MRLDRDTFELMCKEFPKIKKELMDDATFRSLVVRYSRETRGAIVD